MDWKDTIVTKNKLKLQRGYSYISALAIPFLVAREAGRMIPGISWEFLFILAIIGVWLIGHVDFIHFWKNELKYSLTKNPEWESKMGLNKNEKIRKRLP